MPAAYVTIPGGAIKAQSRSLVVTRDDRVLASIEIEHLSLLGVFGRVQVTTPALLLLLAAGVPVAFFSRTGRLRGRLVPPTAGASDARLCQYALHADSATRVAVARSIVARKLSAMLGVVDRYVANHPEAHDPILRHRLQNAADSLPAAATLKSILGIEGSAAAAYFGALGRLNRSPLKFQGRSTRPPPDEFNALLSFGYALLVNETWSLLDALGLDPFLGLYHQIRPGRPSLALDLIEPFRHAVVDRAVLRAANRAALTPAHFETSTARGVRLTRKGLRRFLALYEKAMLAPPDPSLLLRDDRTAETTRDLLRRRCEAALAWFRNRTPSITTDPDPD